MSSEKTITVEDIKRQFDVCLDLLKILNGYSAKLTELAKAICRSINLTEDLRIILTLKRFYEYEIEEIPLKSEIDKAVKTIVSMRRDVEGLYNPKKKTIILPILDPPRDICTTLAHELTHHCQFVCHTNSCRDICEYWLSPEEADEIRLQIPYDLRPYEIEAYGKDKSLCSKISEFKEFKEFVDTMVEAFNKVGEWIVHFKMACGSH
uniref:Uncharacterized protein n=1 Tax=Ignisphaera aggregans TaxID=334771 RepID=A0A7J2U0Y7_9CREN